MSGFMYLACIITGVISGGALGMIVGVLVTREPWGRYAGGVIGAIILTALLLRMGRKLQKALSAQESEK
jgi:ABC-type cobalamin transport system permease subunit